MRILSWKEAACVCGNKFNCFCPNFSISDSDNVSESDRKKIEILQKEFQISSKGEIPMKVKLDVNELEKKGFFIYVSSDRRPFPEAVAFQRGMWKEDGRYGGEVTETMCNIFLAPPKMRGLVFTYGVLQDGDTFRKNIWA